MNKWTRFMDMHSGGRTKEEPYQYIYIEALEREAKSVFYARFGHSPDRISCTCCGEDYSVDESESFEQASAYDRGAVWAYPPDADPKDNGGSWKAANQSGRYFAPDDEGGD